MDLNSCAAQLREKDEILIVTHKRPDGDTLGSAAALCRGLRQLGKQAYLFPNPEITETYADMVAPYLAPAGYVPAFVMSVDLADVNLFPHDFSGRIELSVDHHGSNTEYADETLVMSDCAACGEIIYALLLALGCSIEREIANALYIALATDTGCFCYANTNANTLRVASELLAAGAENAAINKRLFRTVSRARVLLEGMICTGMQFFADGRIVVSTITLEMMERSGATDNDCDDLANIAGKVAGGLAALTVKEKPDGKTKVSIRTTGIVNANEIAQKFDGGGHTMASGCAFDCDYHEATRRLVAAIEEVLA
ncbi:MAG: DHH family phosphoesterase [Oscillospiraceae bacterium]|jgi:phosphoesterase RecJ-like protein